MPAQILDSSTHGRLALGSLRVETIVERHIRAMLTTRLRPTVFSRWNCFTRIFVDAG